MARVLRVEGLAKYDAAASAEGAVPTLDRLVAILREALGDGANEKFPLVQVANSARGTICFTRGTQERIAAVQAVFDELAKDPPVHVRLQCSLVTLPAAVALEHGLKPNLVKATDETAFGKLVRAAMQKKGTLGTCRRSRWRRWRRSTCSRRASPRRRATRCCACAARWCR